MANTKGCGKDELAKSAVVWDELLPFVYFRIGITQADDSPVEMQTIQRAFQAAVQSAFGIIGGGTTLSGAKLVLFREADKKAILQVPRESYKKVWAALVVFTTLDGKAMRIDVEDMSSHVSGLSL